LPITEPIEARAREVRSISVESEPTWKQKFYEKRERAKWNMGRLLRSVKERGRRFYRRHFNMIVSLLIVLAYVAAMTLFFVIYLWLMSVSPWLALVWCVIFIWLCLWSMMASEDRSRQRSAQRIRNIRFA
jgi:FtsH-binding integral membrane protein